MGWIDVKKAYYSVDHGSLREMMVFHKFPVWLCRVISNLSNSWSTRIVAKTKKGRQISEPIRFNKGLPQRNAFYPRLFTVCLNPIALKRSATEGYKLSKPVGTKVTDLLYIDLKIFVSWAEWWNPPRAQWEISGPQWNPKKCAVVRVKRGMHVKNEPGPEAWWYHQDTKPWGGGGGHQ